MSLNNRITAFGLLLTILITGCGYNPKHSGKGLPPLGFKGTVECLYSGCHDSIITTSGINPAVSWASAFHSNQNAWPDSASDTCMDCHDPLDDSDDSDLIFTSNPFAISSNVRNTLGLTARPIVGCEACHGSGMEHYAYMGTTLYYGDHREPMPSTVLDIFGNPFHQTSCGPCHSRSHHAGGASLDNILTNQYAEWWQGDGLGVFYDDGHSDSLVVETAQGFMTSTVRGIPCGACHTVEGFVTYFAKGDTSWALSQSEIDRIISETGDTNVADPSSFPGSAALPQVSCISCHSSHEPGNLIRSPFTNALLCVTCHNVRDLLAETGSGQSGTSGLEIPRHPQKEVFEGVKTTSNDGYRGVESLPSFISSDSTHAGSDNIPGGCAGCHYLIVPDVNYDELPLKATTGHTFRPRLENCLSNYNLGGCHDISDFLLSDGSAASYEDSTIASFDFGSIYYSGAAHPGMDYDGDSDVEPLQEEIEGMLDELKDSLTDRGIDFDSDLGLFDLTEMAARTTTERAAAYNYDFIVEDRSLGYHNPIYVVNLLAVSISAVP